ncbi:MAG: hypothetical protein GXP22_01810 [Gammaproteobacteria bacterium]|nr:hypothetical protein [Gammaproteobacteria bacterium]
MPYKIHTVYLVTILLLTFVAGNYLFFNDSTPQKTITRTERLFNQFSSEIVPVLNVRCNNCHALETKKYKQVEKNLDTIPFAKWEVNASGDLETLPQQRIAYTRFTYTNKKSSRKFSPLGFRNDHLASPILRVPLANNFSGVRHPEIFSSVNDPDFKKMLSWVKEEIEFRRETPPRPLTSNEKFFAKKIIPILVRKNCFGCHGLNAFNDLKMDTGIPAYKERFTDEMVSYNRKAMLGMKTRQVNLSGSISQSRQLVKNIPISDGGIIHKGGNHFFRKNDPDFKILLK